MVPPAWAVSRLWRSVVGQLGSSQSWALSEALGKSCAGAGSHAEAYTMLWKNWNYRMPEYLVPFGQLSLLPNVGLDVGDQSKGCGVDQSGEWQVGLHGRVTGNGSGRWQAWDVGNLPREQSWQSCEMLGHVAMGSVSRGMCAQSVEAQEDFKAVTTSSTRQAMLAKDDQTAFATGLSMVQPKQRVVPVYAYFVGRKIDLVGVSNDPQVRNFRRASGRDHVIIENPEKGNQGGSAYLVVYKYGSIVLFNAPIREEEHRELMHVCQRYTSEPVAQPNHEVQSVVVLPQMTNWYRQDCDRIKLKELDLNNMRVISSVLGQSVALDQYSRQIDRALQEFNSINREMERTGSFTVTRQELFRLVARNNTMITEAILVLGLLDRSDTAWTNDRYYGVWSMMQSEYELAQRFEAMDKKLSLIQESAKYFLQILQDNKSVSLEWFIIILIMAELVVGVYDLATRH